MIIEISIIEFFYRSRSRKHSSRLSLSKF